MNEPAADSNTPPPPPDAPVFERGLWGRTWFMILLCLVFVALDWELVPLQVFPFIFIFPVMLVAWNRPLWLSTVCAGALSTTRILHELVFSTKTVSPEELADTLICFFVLQLLVVLTMLLARQARQLRRRVQALEELLPICSFCKSIRNERDEWIRLEEFMAQHSGATFSHGLCPDCAKKHYGDFYPPKKKD
jgi:K+-sensing histidine kinase KdpD